MAVQPTQSTVAPDASVKISHARILLGYRSESEAATFHKKVKATNP